MSMIGNFYMLEDEIIQKIENKDLSFEEILYDENDDIIDKEKSLDIDKSWHMIHFTLTGKIDEGEEDNPLSKIIFNGRFLGEEEIGYGPVLLIRKEEVKSLSLILSKLGEDELREKFNVSEMIENDIYSVYDNDRNDSEGLFKYIYAYFLDMRNFFMKASEGNQNIVFYIN